MLNHFVNLLTKRTGAAMAALVLGLSFLAPVGVTYAQAPAADTTAAPAAAASTAPVAAPPAATGREAIENPYGLQALWSESDLVAKIVLVIMVIMSIGTWYIMASKVLELSRINSQAKEAEDRFWSAPSIAEGTNNLKESSPFRFVAQAGLESTKKHDGLRSHISYSDWVAQSVQRATEGVQSNMQNGLAFLATVGSTAPFVGLFGTVWGIYHALVKIGTSGQASIDQVAGPVGEALIMTAIGLAVAVPAVLGYNFIVRRNKTTLDKVRAFGTDLHSVLMSSAPK